jgi:hypothetical protein
MIRGRKSNKYKCCQDSKNNKAPIAAVTFGGALLCLCFISHTLLVLTVGVSCIALGVYLLRNCR